MKDQFDCRERSTVLQEHDPSPGPGAKAQPVAEEALKVALQLAAAQPEDFYLRELAPARLARGASTGGCLPVQLPTCFVVRVTGRCNLACDYCFDAANGAPRGNLDFSTARRIADYILSVPVDKPLISLIGGEPLLNWRVGRSFIEMLRTEGRARGKDPYFIIVTNGTPITTATARELVRADTTVQISIDGPARGRVSHRKYRNGADSYPEALRGLRRLRDVDPAARVDAQVVLTPGNVNLIGLARKLKAAGFRRIRFLHDTPGGEDRGGWAEEDIRALMQARTEFFPYFLRSALRGEPEVDMDFAMLVASQPGGPGGLCGCARREVYIDSFGDLYPCPKLYGQTGVRFLGNCATVDPAAPLPFSASGLTPDPECGRCWAFELCRGGCAFQCQRCALKPSDSRDANQELWCDLLRAQFARSAIAYRFLKQFHPRGLESIRAIFFGESP